jgi:hypothetical protein
VDSQSGASNFVSNIVCVRVHEVGVNHFLQDSNQPLGRQAPIDSDTKENQQHGLIHGLQS